MSKNKKDAMDWFDSHVVVVGLDKKANKKTKDLLKAKLKEKFVCTEPDEIVSYNEYKYNKKGQLIKTKEA